MSMIHTLSIATHGYVGLIIIKTAIVVLTIWSILSVVHTHTAVAGVNVAVIVI